MSETTALPADLRSLLVRAIADPGKVVQRGDDYREPIPQWSARAVEEGFLPAYRELVIDQIACQPPGTVVMTDAELAERDAVIRQQVRAEVADEVEAYALRLRDAAVDRVLSDDPGKHAAARRYATVMYVAQALRNSADLNVLAERKGDER